MGLIGNWLGFEKRDLNETNAWQLIVQALRRGDSGPVTPASSMQIAAVFSCVRVLSESIAQLPLRLMEEDGRNRQPAKAHPLYRMLNFLPNPEMTSAEFRLTMMGHLALWGNAYAQITFDRAGRRRQLWPLRPDRMTVTRGEDGQRVYRYDTTDGPEYFEWPEIMHLRGGSLDGVTGYSPVGMVRRTFELKQRMDEYGAAFWENDARPGMVLKHPKTLSEKARTNILNSWEDRHRGPAKTNRPALLEEGLDIVSVGIPQTDAQFLESQKFTRSEIAAIFRVPPHMIGDLERATFSNIEEQAQEFVDYTLAPWIVIWQQGIKRDLLTESEQDRYYVHFAVQALLRGKHTDRAQFYATMQQVGAMSPNDIREYEDLNPIDGGDVYLVPLNMQNVEMAGEAPTPVAAPVKAAADEEEPHTETQRSADANSDIADLITFLLSDVERRLRARVANDVRQQGAKALRNGGRTGLSEWGETMAHDWRTAGEGMLEPLCRGAEAAHLVASSDTILAAVDVGRWVASAYQDAVRGLIEGKDGD